MRSELIGNVFGRSVRGLTFETVLKHFAYEGGPDVLEELLSGCDATVAPPSPGQSLTNYWSRQFQASATRRCVATIGDANLSDRNYSQLLQLVSSLSSRQAPDADDPMRTAYQEYMHAFVKGWHILTGREGRRQLKLPLSGGSIEPRVSDQIRAADDPEFAAAFKAKMQRPLNH